MIPATRSQETTDRLAEENENESTNIDDVSADDTQSDTDDNTDDVDTDTPPSS